MNLEANACSESTLLFSLIPTEGAVYMNNWPHVDSCSLTSGDKLQKRNSATSDVSVLTVNRSGHR